MLVTTILKGQEGIEMVTIHGEGHSKRETTKYGKAGAIVNGTPLQWLGHGRGNASNAGGEDTQRGT